MAIYHCSCKIISRGKGRSAVGASAYRSGERLTNDYDGLTHDYTNKGGVVYSEIMLCENAPQEYQNRSVLWNEVERIEKGATAQLAREYEVALPVELNHEEQIQLVRDYVRENFVKAGMCADFAIHDKEDGNPHAHIMLTTRPIEKDGTWGTKAINEYVLDKDGNRILQKIDKQNRKIYKRVKTDTTDWNTKDFLNKNRADWAAIVNRELEKKNFPQRIDHRSLQKQGKEQIPTEHLGVAAKNIEKRGEVSDRGERNRAIKKANRQLQNIKYLEKQTKKEVAFIREDIMWSKSHEQVEKFEKSLPQIEHSEKALRTVQAQLERIYKEAKSMKLTKASEGRTVTYDLREIPYFEYHRNKMIADVAEIKDKVQRSLSILEEQHSQQPRTAYERLQGKQEAVKEKVQERKAEPAKQPQEIPQTFDVGAVAQRLAEYRAAYMKATMQKQERTTYQENPIYRQQAAQIADLVKRIKEQGETIQTLQTEKGSLGVFKGKEKKALQEKITKFELLRRSNIEKLKELGVSDPARAEEAIKEKIALAAAEQAKVKAARGNVGAADRAEEAKAAFLRVAEQIPPDQRQAVLDRMEQYKEQEQPEAGRLQYFKAEMEASRQLDTALKPTAQEKNRSRAHEWGREH